MMFVAHNTAQRAVSEHPERGSRKRQQRGRIPRGSSRQCIPVQEPAAKRPCVSICQFKLSGYVDSEEEEENR